MARPGNPGKVSNLPGYTLMYGAPFIPGAFAYGGNGRIFWVGNGTLGSGTYPSGNGASPEYPLSTLAAAVAKCVAGRGDIIYVLPGHAENISTADYLTNLKANTKIIGLGPASSGPSSPTARRLLRSSSPWLV